MAGGLVGPIDLLKIWDTVASGVVEELDFRSEAQNSRRFEESLSSLGYATVPQIVGEPTPKMIITEWIYGRHLEDLTEEEAMRFCAMSVEAVTAGLVCTGLVHADPHEGNMVGLHCDPCAIDPSCSHLFCLCWLFVVGWLRYLRCWPMTAESSFWILDL